MHDRHRPLPRPGETWQHYKGQNCYILGILRSGSRWIGCDVVAYELVDRQQFSNHDTGMIESTQLNSRSRFFKPVVEFMGHVNGVNRFEIVDEDISAEIWEQSFALCEKP